MADSKKDIILITGASGQLGRRLAPMLVHAGYGVRAHFRSKEKARRYCPEGAEAVFGDLLEPSWLPSAVRGCDIVIHTAAKVSMRPTGAEEMYRINVGGTEEVVRACLENGVRRLIHVSSIVAVGASEDGEPVDERLSFNLHGTGIPYVDTKRKAEEAALSANGEVLEVVAVNPSIMFALPEREILHTDIKKIPKWIPAYFDFGVNIVETDDAARGILECIERGKAGERYILSGTNLTPDNAFKLAREYFGVKGPYFKIPRFLLYLAAYIAEKYRQIKGKRPKFHRGLVRLARYKFIYSYKKAADELGFAPRPMEESLRYIISRIEHLRKNQ
ncbi:MAG: NAD-dependent epimerase/dehydratase family protein [candidate division Zixibacteria bacterium]|nr:NAD-dependent epimerase/dehydratase family protein [candidate division Zixibacteria bacterium]